MPKCGFTSVSIPKYVWEAVKEYYYKNEKALRAKGINSPSKLIIIWLTEKAAEYSTLKTSQPKG